MTELARTEFIPFTKSQREWNFDMQEVIKHVDPQGNGSPAEHKYFFELCKAQNLNPLIKEVYFIKYGGNPAAVVINVDTFVSRANEYPDYNGYTAGWTVGTETDHQPSEVPFGKLLGAWCKVGRKDKHYDIVATVRLDAFNTGKSRWKIDPWGMIQKCAIAAAHRKAYPKAFTGMYEWSEMDQAKDGVVDITPKKKATTKVAKVAKVANSPEPQKEEPVAESVAETTEQPEPSADAQWNAEGIGADVAALMNPEGNPDKDAVFDIDSYNRIKDYKNANFSAWKEQLSEDDFNRVVSMFKQLREEFPEDVINSSQPV